MSKTSRSEKCLQIKRLPDGMTVTEFQNELKNLAGKADYQKCRASQLRMGLAVNTIAGEKIRIGTVSCPSERIKSELMKQAKIKRVSSTRWKDVVVEDHFSSLTILYTPPDFAYPTADICFVHGLDGNAMDTFSCDSGDNLPPILWPRDLLAKHKDFKAARIMTYGYNSGLFDGKDRTEMRDWREGLLEALKMLRNSDEAGGIPLILIGYSLGGLVVREALAALIQHPGSYTTTADQCGAIFLGTPHLGSFSADFGGIPLTLGSAFGLRQELVDYLKTFTPMLLESQKAWLEKRQTAPKSMPIVCFCEARESKAGPLGHKMIVEKVSAGFMGEEAICLGDTDHYSICKFPDSTDKNFDIVTTKLSEMIRSIRNTLAQLESQDSGSRNRPLPGDPPAVSPCTPIKPLSFGVRGGRSKLDFFGRKDELGELKTLVDNDRRESGEPILITGIGGIGKTELALQVARDSIQSSNPESRSHVFFLRAAELDASYEALAWIIGSEILLVSQSLEFLDDNWKAMPPQQKAQAFKFWLKMSEDAKIIVIDDVDFISEEDTNSEEDIIDLVLPRKAQTLILTTRDPYFLRKSKPRKLALREMQTPDVVKAMKEGLRDILSNSGDRMNSDEQLKMIGDALGNHPLGVRHAIEMMSDYYFDPTGTPTEIFLQSFSSADHQFRREFLGTYFDNQTILDCFDISIRRLHSGDPRIRRSHLVDPRLKSLLNFAGFLTTEAQEKDLCYFFYEIVPRNWDLLRNLREQLEDFDLLGLATTNTGRSQLNKYIGELVKVSLVTRSGTRLQTHKLWIECIRQLAEEMGRVRYVKQIILICDTILSKRPWGERDEAKNKLLPYINACNSVLQSFSMSFDLVRPPLYPQQLSLKDYMIYWGFRAEARRQSIQAMNIRTCCRKLSTQVQAQSLQSLNLGDERLQDPRNQAINIFKTMTEFFHDSSDSSLSHDDLEALNEALSHMKRFNFLVPDNFRFMPTLDGFGKRIDERLLGA